jgi:hypothetical protein
MLNAYGPVHYKVIAFISFPQTCWVRQLLTLAINNVAQKEEAAMKMLLILGVHNPQSTACDVWSLRFQD